VAGLPLGTACKVGVFGDMENSVLWGWHRPPAMRRAGALIRFGCED
jgi:hypothetical protein